MKFHYILISAAFAFCFASGAQALAARPSKNPSDSSPRVLNRLICKTGSEKRAPGQPLKLFFQYDMPFQFEPDDPTVPYGRQTFVLAGRQMVQLSFEKAPGPAGEHGEDLAPMQCAFAKRALMAREPSQVQILIQPGEVAWLSQTLGQKPSGGPERTLLAPAGTDWSFAYRFDQVFTIDLDDAKDFVTGQKPRAL